LAVKFGLQMGRVMKKLLVGTVFGLLALSACGPRDVAVTGTKNFGNSTTPSGPAVVEKAGTRAESCPAKNPNATYITGAEENDARIFSGEVSAYLSPGDRNCFLIGSEVNLQNASKANPNAPIRAKLKVIRVEIVAAADMTTAQAAALGMTLTEAKAYAQQEMDRTKDIFKSNGMVTITFYELNKSSVDPTKLVTPPDDTGNGGASEGTDTVQTIMLVAQEGTRSPTCPEKNTDWLNLTAPEVQDAQILSGAITATIGIGDRNCYKIGSILPLQNGKAGPVRAQVIINQVQIVPYSALNKIQAKALGMELAALKLYARTELDKAKAAAKFDPKETVTITFFEISDGAAPVVDDGPAVPSTPVSTPVGTPVATPVTTPVATPVTPAVIPEPLLITIVGERSSTCPTKNTDYSYISIPTMFDAQIFSGAITADISSGDRNCFRVGAEVVLQASLKSDPNAPVRAKLKIEKVLVIHRSKLTDVEAKALGSDLVSLQARIDKMFAAASGSFDPKGMVSLTFFSVVSSIAPVTTPVATPAATAQ
jgi:hypothetical protein